MTDSEFTNDICLEEITIPEFERRMGFWDKSFRTSYFNRYYAIAQTFVWDNSDDYEGLIRFLIGHSYADHISVNIDKTKQWIKRKKEEMDEKTIGVLAKIARRHPDKKRYFELLFHDGSTTGLSLTPWNERCRIEFIEHEGRLIVNDVTIPANLAHLFTVPCDPHAYYKLHHGLWVPDHYANL